MSLPKWPCFTVEITDIASKLYLIFAKDIYLAQRYAIKKLCQDIDIEEKYISIDVITIKRQEKLDVFSVPTYVPAYDVQIPEELLFLFDISLTDGHGIWCECCGMPFIFDYTSVCDTCNLCGHCAYKEFLENSEYPCECWDYVNASCQSYDQIQEEVKQKIDEWASKIIR